MGNINPLVNTLICPKTGSATDLGIQFGGGLLSSSGTGFFSDVQGEIGIACAGSEVFRFTASGGSEVGELFLADGTAAAPALAFKGTSANTGLYLAATDSLGFSANGTTCGNYSATGVWQLNGALNVGVGTNNAANVINVIGAPSTALTGVGQSGVNVDQIFNTTAATGAVHGFRAAVSTLAAAYTTAQVSSFRGVNPTIGAASTATRACGAYLDMPTGGGTGNAILCDNITFTGNFGINLATTNASAFAGPICTNRTNVASTATIAALAITSSYVKLTGSTATDLQGITAGKNGQMIVVANLTGQNLTIRNQSASAASGAKITTMTGADITTTGNGAAGFIYDTDASPAEWTCLWTTA